MRIVSLRVVSLMAIVPDSEWRIPTLMVALCAWIVLDVVATAPSRHAAKDKYFSFMGHS
jgi:hypothetical protein